MKRYYLLIILILSALYSLLTNAGEKLTMRKP